MVNPKSPEDKSSSNDPSLTTGCLNGNRFSDSTSEYAVVVVGIRAGVVVGVAVVVLAMIVVVVFWVIEGFFSLSSIFALSLLPNSLFHGILPRITLEAVVVVIAVVDGSLCVFKNGSIVILWSLETSGLDSVCV